MPRLSALILLLAAVPAFSAETAAPAAQVRDLAIQVTPLKAAELSQQHGARLFVNGGDAAKALGDEVMEQLKGKVDFEKEAVSLVTWGTSGPPFGELKYEVKTNKKRAAIHFFVKEPTAPVRGMAYRMGCDFFAVPRTAVVSFGGAP